MPKRIKSALMLAFRWLEARASLANPAGDDSDDVMDAKQDDVDGAGRQLLSAPAVLNWMVWMKWEVLEFCINQDMMDGKHIDNRSVVALLPNSSRRAALGLLARASALAILPVPAIAASLEVDPIFAAIKRHNEAWRAFGATCPRIDNVVAENEGRGHGGR
jgi:hypothetical protein